MTHNTTLTSSGAADNGQAPQSRAARVAPPLSDATLRKVEPALRTVDAALDHVSPLNRHRTALLRGATDNETVFSVYTMLTHQTALYGNLALAKDDGHAGVCIDCWVEGYVKRGLLEPGDGPALDAALTSVARHAVGFPTPPTEDEIQLVAYQPQALIRAAYALARDMAA